MEFLKLFCFVCVLFKTLALCYSENSQKYNIKDKSGFLNTAGGVAIEHDNSQAPNVDNDGSRKIEKQEQVVRGKLQPMYPKEPRPARSYLSPRDHRPALTPLEQYRARVNRGLLAVYDMSNTFLERVVQPRTLDQLINSGFDIDKVREDPRSLQENWQDIAKYAWGFTLAAAVGVVTSLGMLLAALITPCCRACARCGGGKRPPRDLESDAGKVRYRICCGTWLGVFTLGALLSSLALFGINEEIRSQISGDDSAFDEIIRGLGGIKPFLQTSVLEINASVYGGARSTKDAIFTAFYRLPQDGLNSIESRANLTSTLETISDFSDNLHDINNSVKYAENLASTLDSVQISLTSDLGSIRTDLEGAIQNCVTAPCQNLKPEVANLGTGLDFRPIRTNLTVLSRTFDDVIGSGISDDLNKLNQTLRDVTADVISDLTTRISRAEKDANDVIDKELLARINDLGDAVNGINLQDAKDVFVNAKASLEQSRAAEYIYIGIIIIASVSCMVVVLAVVGVLHGTCEARSTHDRKCCPADRASGADWLFAAIGLIFVFFWLLMLGTLGLFTAGGLVHTEVCRYVVHYDEPGYSQAVQILQNTTTEYIPPELQQYNISLLAAYNNCRHDQTLYTALDLQHNGFDLQELLDLSSIRSVIDDVKKAPINFPSNIVLLTEEFNRTLYSLGSVLSSVNFDLMLRELRGNITYPAELDEFVTQLRSLSGEPGVDDLALTSTLTSLTQQGSRVSQAEQQKQTLAENVQDLQKTIGNTDFSQLADSLMTSQTYVNTQGENLIRDVINITADDAFVYLENFINQTVDSIENNITRCYPLYHSVSMVTTAVCVSGLYQVTGLAFALGATVFFLFLTLILSFKVADHYRRPVAWVCGNVTEPEVVGATDEMYFRRSLEHEPIDLKEGAEGGYVPTAPPAVNPVYLQDDVTSGPTGSVPDEGRVRHVTVEPARYPTDNVAPPPYPLPTYGYSSNPYNQVLLRNPPNRFVGTKHHDGNESLFLNLA